jgi:Domain of unknown function (DUF4386)
MSRTETFRLDCRLTGLFYLGVAITGALGFLMIRAELFVEGDPARTLANLVEHERMARFGIALELGIVTFQALAALWFARLFRATDAFAAGALALLGMVNAIVVLASAALMRAALDSALGPTGSEPTTSHLLFLISGRFWEVGNIFFGLWLVPMGWLAWKAAFGHRALGWILIVGGIGYVLSPFVAVLAPHSGGWLGLLPLLATVGEFWMIGLLLWTGLRRAPA